MKPCTIFPLMLLVTGAFMLGTGCKSSEKASNENAGEITKAALPADAVDSTVDRMDPQFGVTPDGNGGYVIYVTVGGGGDASSPPLRALYRITSLSVDIFTPDGKPLAQVQTNDITTSGVANSETKETSLTAYGKVAWKPAAPPARGTYAVATLHTDSGRVARRIVIAAREADPSIDGKSVAMTVDVDSRGTNVEFRIRVERIAPPPEGEYLPSGEQIRVELRSDIGETVWTSSTGMAFTQAIGAVEPSEVGKSIEHRVLWDGRDERTRTRALPGSYRIIVTIPAKPTPYILREEFTWSGR